MARSVAPAGMRVAIDDVEAAALGAAAASQRRITPGVLGLAVDVS
jgi:hypothetical protein